MKTVSPQRLAQIFVEFADTLAADFDHAGFLHMLTVRVADLVDACAVGIQLADDKGDLRLQAMTTSDEPAKVADFFRMRTGEGPCHQAHRIGEPVADTDLCTADPRWPRFAAHATAVGFYAVHAFSLQRRNQAFGTLTVFGHQVGGGFEVGDIAVVQALTDVAAIALVQKHTISRSQELAGQLQTALNTRIVIEQAKGAIAQARNVSVDVAFDVLRDYARSHNRQLGAVAHAAINDPAMFTEPAKPQP